MIPKIEDGNNFGVSIQVSTQIWRYILLAIHTSNAITSHFCGRHKNKRLMTYEELLY